MLSVLSINVDLWPHWITSQIIAFIAVLLGMYSLLRKRKTETLLYGAFVPLFLALSVLLLDNWVVFYILLLAGVRNFLFSWFALREEQGRPINPKITFLAMLSFMAATIVAVAFTWEWWFDWLLLASSLFIIYGGWAKGIHKMRIGFFSYDSLVIVNFIVYLNVIGILMSVLLLGSTVVFYIRYFKKRKNELSKSAKHIPENIQPQRNDALRPSKKS